MAQRFQALVLAVIFAAGTARSESVGHAEAGAEVFEMCSGCHEIGKGAQDAIGPHLNGLFGRPAAAHDGFAYSASMRRAGVDGLVWDWPRLDAYIANPRALVSKTRMSFDGLKDAQERADLLAYLRRFSDNPQNIPEAAPTARGT
ncbi:MAG: cytochrome c family protein, partial [Roseovarius sp.]|nr:cytochrome c family protein [Roseovarius sp.]